ncbi:uncharacterized protein LOC119575720 [Penaeus monodon]|uniref:uncharacterized protein LOC119575720 n=1 Tax=Penaeus monodon TaxID=6687 RepID=UPI0018A6D821|nr:uncharacterized protein LOC119575720 [Penaeus monodon]
MVVRFNATLITQLAKYCEEDQHDSDEWVPYMLMVYRAAEHKATGFTPSCLMFSHEIRLPVDLATGKLPDERLPAPHTEYVRTLQCRMEETRHQASQHLKMAGQAMWRRYNEWARDAMYCPGDQVWLHKPLRRSGKSPKLQNPWEGLYTVTERISATRADEGIGVNTRQRLLTEPSRTGSKGVQHPDTLIKVYETVYSLRKNICGKEECKIMEHGASILETELSKA